MMLRCGLPSLGCQATFSEGYITVLSLLRFFGQLHRFSYVGSGSTGKDSGCPAESLNSKHPAKTPNMSYSLTSSKQVKGGYIGDYMGGVF